MICGNLTQHKDQSLILDCKYQNLNKREIMYLDIAL